MPKSRHLLPFFLAIFLLGSVVSHGQYGVYLDLHRRDTFPPPHVNNELVDGVMIVWPWQELQPEAGGNAFDRIESNIEPWVSAGKKVIIGIAPAAQTQTGFTPAWVYNRVPKVTFRRAGDNYDISVPKYWDPSYVGTITPIIRAMGAQYDSDSRIEAVMISVGHLGYITAAPSNEGAAAFIKAGWTPQRWQDFCNKMIGVYRSAFPTKKLIMRGAGMLMAVPNPSKVGFTGKLPYFTDVRDTILSNAASKRVTVGSNGLEADTSDVVRTGLNALFTKLSPGARLNRYQLEFSDDWPLWVDANRRKSSPADAGKDNAYYAACLSNAVGQGPGLNPYATSWIKLLESDLDCTDPTNLDYQPDCQAKLAWLKTQFRKPR